MLNFKFLKWAALCGLLVFALSGCAKDEPCGGGGGEATDTGSLRVSIDLKYLSASDSFPLIGGEEDNGVHRFTMQDVTISGLSDSSYKEGSATLLHYQSGISQPAYTIIVFMFESCSGQNVTPGLCYAAKLKFKDAFTDTLEVYMEETGLTGECEAKYRLAFYLNGEFLTYGSTYYSYGYHLDPRYHGIGTREQNIYR